MERARQIERRDARVLQHAPEPRGEVPHVRGGQELRVPIVRELPAEGVQRPEHVLDHDRMLLTILGRRAEPLGVPAILRRIARARRRPRERVRPDLVPEPRDQEFGARADERPAVPDVDRERVPVGLDRAEPLQQLPRIQRPAGLDADRPREHDLAEHPASDPIDRLGDRAFVRLGERLGEDLHPRERLAGLARPGASARGKRRSRSSSSRSAQVSPSRSRRTVRLG